MMMMMMMLVVQPSVELVHLNQEVLVNLSLLPATEALVAKF